MQSLVNNFLKFSLVILAYCTAPAYAKHPQCAGSLEPEKCEKMRDELAQETPAQKKERIKKTTALADATRSKVDAEAKKQERALKAKKGKKASTLA